MSLSAPVPGLTAPPVPCLLQPQAPPATPSLPSLPAACPGLSLSASFSCLPLPTRFRRTACAVGTDSNSCGFCGHVHPSSGYLPPCPGRRALGWRPFPLQGWPGWPGKGQGTASVCSAHVPLTVTPHAAVPARREEGTPRALRARGPDCW